MTQEEVYAELDFVEARIEETDREMEAEFAKIRAIYEVKNSDLLRRRRELYKACIQHHTPWNIALKPNEY